ncbi:cation:proton antiporter [Sinomicrobium weinanense]|uniref:Cation:proton antiporter n=1 Tax=Sinomicrobium weinanense TaxID=2842200 RepID=A0A926JNU4_9FLAO|nr:cation:proton antiporter [Sinomicrobium weinanense]MBC9794594.1 cation:proton antiporter [Sinomicrobium weinanense]MBU3124079.1 cation:proton antiporter [Sinomicrobium weinanense]
MELELLNLFLVLVVAWIGGSVATRVGYPSILGELIAGIIFGPALLQVLAPTETTTVLAEIGVLLMMLYIGMEIDFRELGKASWAGLLAAIGGFIVPFALGYYAVLGFGGSNLGALFVAIAVGVTSLATKSRILVDLKLLNTRIAHVLMAGALISDTLALIIFAGIISFTDAGSIEFLEILVVTGKAVLFFAVTGLLGIYVLPYLGKQLEKAGFTNRTLFFTIMLIIAIGFAELAELAGLHSILGAFIAGLFLRESIFNRKLSKELNKVFYDISIGFLAPIFFVTAGYHVTFDVFQNNLTLLIVILIVAVVGKIFGTALFYLPSGNGWREGITVGTGMNGRGAVEIVIAGIGLSLGFIDNEIFSILVFMAIFTTATVPVFLTWTTTWLRKRGELVLSSSEKKGILFLGAGPLSLYIAKKLNNKAPLSLIDSNIDNCVRANNLGLKCIQGNALKEETLMEAGGNEAGTFVSLTNNSEINVLAAQLASETMGIPNIYVSLTPSTEGANVELLDPIGASTIFAKKTDPYKWDYKLENKAFEEILTEITEHISSRDFLKQISQKEGDILPIFYENGEGELNIYHYGIELEPGYKVHYLK